MMRRHALLAGLVAGLAASPAAAAQGRLPPPLPPTAANPAPFGMDTISSGIPERAQALRAAVRAAYQRGLIGGEEASRLALPLDRILRLLSYHTPRGYRERVGLRQRLDAVQADLDRDLAGR